MAGWKRLQELRESKGLSRAALAAKANTTETQIYRLETGARDMERASYGLIRLLAEGLGVRVADLMEYSDAVDTFVRRLEQMDRRTLAELSKGAGGQIADADALTLRPFYEALPPDVSDDDAGIWYEAGCIIADGLRRESRDSDSPRESLPLILGRMAQAEGEVYSPAVERAIRALDNEWTPGDGTAEKVGKSVRIAVQDGHRVDYRALLTDALEWNDPDHHVRQSWADQMMRH